MSAATKRRQLHDGGEAEVEHEQLQQERRAADDLDPAGQRDLQRPAVRRRARSRSATPTATASAIAQAREHERDDRGAKKRRQISHAPPSHPRSAAEGGGDPPTR